MTVYDEAAARFKALGHPVRLQILDLLRGGEVCVCHLEASLGRRQAYISQQLMVLRDAGLVEARKEGLQVYYRLAGGTTGALLEAALGASTPAAFIPVPDCPCPSCAVPESQTIRA